MSSRVTRRYAKAIFDLAQDSRLSDRIEQDLRLIREVYRQHPRLVELLDSPVLTASSKRKIMEELFKEKIHPTTSSFVNLLLEKKRENLLAEIIQYFFVLVDQSQGIVRGQLYSTHPLSPEQLAALKKQLDRMSGKNVILEQRLDPELLGGFIIRMDDTIIDRSLKNQLIQLRNSLLATQ